MPTTIPGQAPAGSGSSDGDVPTLRARLAPVLADLTYPARRWQAVAVADLYGCDTVTRAIVDRLPERVYVSLTDLVAVLGAVLTGRYVATPAPVTRTAVPPFHARRSGTAATPGGPGSAAPAPGSLEARRRSNRGPAAPSAVS